MRPGNASWAYPPRPRRHPRRRRRRRSREHRM